MLRSAGSPWNLLRCGRRWTTSSSADCACQMQLPKAFVFRQLIFGINANPHCKSFRSHVCDSVWPRRGLLAVCGTYFARHRATVDFLPLLSLPFFCFISSMLGHDLYVFGRPSDFSSGLGAASKPGRVATKAAITAHGLARRLRRARVSALPVTQLESAPPRSFARAFSLFFRRHS